MAINHRIAFELFQYIADLLMVSTACFKMVSILKWILILLLRMTNGAFNFEMLNDLPQLEHDKFTSLHLDFKIDNDKLWHEFVQFSQATCVKVGFQLMLENDKCSEKVLRITNKVNEETKYQSNYNFLKNPCLSYLILKENHQNFEALLANPIKNQAFIFVIEVTNEVWSLYELQFFSKKRVHLSTWKNESMKLISKMTIHERRSNFNGLPLRLVKSQRPAYDGIEAEIMLMHLKKRFNFTVHQVKFDGYGTHFSNGSWTGAVGQVHDNEIDVAPLKVSLTPERIPYIKPGFITNKAVVVAIYHAKLQKETFHWNSILKVFHYQLYILLVSIVFVSGFVLTFPECKTRQYLLAFWSMFQPFFGHSIDEDSFTLHGYKWSKRIAIFCISFLGIFIFWCFSGVLTSVLSVPATEVPIKSLDDLNIKKDLVLHIYSSGFFDTFVYKWSKKSVQNQITFQQRVKQHSNYDLVIENLIQDKHAIALSTFSENLGYPYLFNMGRCNSRVGQFSQIFILLPKVV